MSVSGFIKRNPVLSYFALTFTISWGAVLLLICGSGGLPATREQFNAQLPVVILATLTGPSVAGILLTGLVDGRAGFRELKSRLLTWRAGTYAIALLTAPLVLLTTLLSLSLTSPVYLPGLFAPGPKLPLLLTGIAGGLAAGIFEELGWTGFAIPKLRRRYNWLTTALIVGVLWGAWHILTNDVWGSGPYTGDLSSAFFVTMRGFGMLVTQLPAYRMLMVWLYDRTGSLPMAILMHMCLTASNMIFQPLAISGASLLIYDFVSGAVMWGVVAVIIRAARRRSRHNLSGGSLDLDARRPRPV